MDATPGVDAADRRHPGVGGLRWHIRAGRAYTTPVVAEPLGNGFIIPLPYGTDVDWLHNVLAAGGCTLTWNTTEYQLDHPEVILAKDALRAFPWSQRITFAGGGVTHFLTLRRRVPAVEAPRVTA